MTAFLYQRSSITCASGGRKVGQPCAFRSCKPGSNSAPTTPRPTWVVVRQDVGARRCEPAAREEYRLRRLSDYFCAPKTNTVRELKACPGRRIVDGNEG